MGELAPFVLPATGGGSALVGFIYLLRYVTQLHRQLGEAQTANAAANLARAKEAEQALAQARIEYAALNTELMEEGAKWNRRSAAATILRRAYPEEYGHWQAFEARVDEVVRGERSVS